MSYTIDRATGDVVIKGFEEGIADSPYSGIADMRNVNLISIPGEASVNFSTTAISPTVSNGTVTSANSGTEYLTYTGAQLLENYMAILFTASTVGGVSINTTYWVANVGGAGAGTFQLYSDYGQTSLVNVTSNGTGTFRVAKVGTNLITTATGAPTYFAYSRADDKYFMQDGTGAIWSNLFTTSSGYWTYLGPSGTADTNSGRGLVYYEASNGNRWIFAFNNGSIDYFNIGTLAWTFGWKPSTGGTSQPSGYLKLNVGDHSAILAPDNKIYYCDGSWIGRFYQADPNTAFNPTNTATYVFDQTQVLPFTDIAQCLAPLGNNLLIGGRYNVVYPWDTFSPLPSYPILIAENNIVKLVTVNTNTFIFVGNRGRIYITNGSQAQLYKKIPDHISGTVEPYFTWGGACSNKNQLYFSALCTTNTGVSVSQYGGVWAIDLDSKALRLTNKLSYGTYAGYASAITPNLGTSPAGTGLYIGWYNGVTGGYGIDTTSSTLYANDQTTIDSDLIPIGTFLKPTTNGRVEFKLAVPMVSGDNLQLSYRQAFSDSFTNVGNVFIYNTNGAGTTYSGVVTDIPFQNSQWIQIRATLNASSSNPSYCRLTELRIGN